jgi:hypothetical protein
MPSDASGAEWPFLRWSANAAAWATAPRSGEFSASAAERAAIAAYFGLVSLDALSLSYELKPAGGGRMRAQARLRAALGQDCVVSGDPVAQRVDETFELEFWPEAEIAALAGDKPDMDADPPEPIRGGRVDFSGPAMELLGLSLDPYPRKPGASFEPPDDAVAQRPHPFGALSKLKG